MVVLVFINSSSFGISSIGRSNIDPLFVYDINLHDPNADNDNMNDTIVQMTSKNLRNQKKKKVRVDINFFPLI